jgi:hypothetical protein
MALLLIEQGMLNAEVNMPEDKTSSFEIPCSIFSFNCVSPTGYLYHRLRHKAAPGIKQKLGDKAEV